MAVFIVLWPYLLTTKLRCLQRNNSGHSKMHVRYPHTSMHPFLSTFQVFSCFLLLVRYILNFQFCNIMSILNFKGLVVINKYLKGTSINDDRFQNWFRQVRKGLEKEDVKGLFMLQYSFRCDISQKIVEDCTQYVVCTQFTTRKRMTSIKKICVL